MLLKTFQNSQENICARVSFLINFFKKDSGTGVFLWIPRNCQEHLFFTEHLRWLLLNPLFYLKYREYQADEHVICEQGNVSSRHSSWWRLTSSSSEDLFKTNMLTLALHLQKTSWWREIYLSWPYVFKTYYKNSSRHLQDVFKTFWRRFQDIFKTSCQDVLQRYFQDVFKTYHQV